MAEHPAKPWETAYKNTKDVLSIIFLYLSESCVLFKQLQLHLRWKDSNVFQSMIAEMGTREAERRRYIWI